MKIETRFNPGQDVFLVGQARSKRAEFKVMGRYPVESITAYHSANHNRTKIVSYHLKGRLKRVQEDLLFSTYDAAQSYCDLMNTHSDAHMASQLRSELEPLSKEKCAHCDEPNDYFDLQWYRAPGYNQPNLYVCNECYSELLEQDLDDIEEERQEREQEERS